MSQSLACPRRGAPALTAQRAPLLPQRQPPAGQGVELVYLGQGVLHPHLQPGRPGRVEVVQCVGLLVVVRAFFARRWLIPYARTTDHIYDVSSLPLALPPELSTRRACADALHAPRQTEGCWWNTPGRYDSGFENCKGDNVAMAPGECASSSPLSPLHLFVPLLRCLSTAAASSPSLLLVPCTDSPN